MNAGGSSAVRPTQKYVHKFIYLAGDDSFSEDMAVIAGCPNRCGPKKLGTPRFVRTCEDFLGSFYGLLERWCKASDADDEAIGREMAEHVSCCDGGQV